MNRNRRQPTRPIRVAFQLFLYAAIASHIASWYVGGQRAVGTLSPNGLFYVAQIGLISVGLVIVIAAVVSTFALGNSFCGWACHFGAAQDFAHWLLTRLRLEPLNLRVHGKVRGLLLIKLLVVNTLLAWWAAGMLPSLFVNLGAPEPCYAIGTWITIVLDVGVLAVATTYIFGHRAFCRLLCPVIPVMRLGNATARRRMRLAGDCVDCGACDRACPMRNAVSAELGELGQVVALDCIRCGRCRDACPVGAIEYSPGPAPSPAVTREVIIAAHRPPSLSIGVKAGLVGIIGYELVTSALARDWLPLAVADHMPNWELFYAAVAMSVAALVYRNRRKEQHAASTQSRLRGRGRLRVLQ
jgi:polyferredoxin